ncbi:hypothetical protein MSG28_001363 [Choristoneura fumiferana]|uniref:Uncharacterized protein n=1 Tax=Choristoneura fumiferana TaxID=7141 RepID=A0ACC0KUE1_CHOFU|nr:hypothetical protein MSG28_001363 [Choristoneura fumiferana]
MVYGCVTLKMSSVWRWRNCMNTHILHKLSYRKVAGEQGNSFSSLIWTSAKLNHALAGLRPWWWHACNVTLHAACCALVARACVTIARLQRPFAALAALLFAVHPVHTEAPYFSKKPTNQIGQSYIFAPFGVETLGPWGPGAKELIKEISSRLVTTTGDLLAGSYFPRLPENIGGSLLDRLAAFNRGNWRSMGEAYVQQWTSYG